MTDLITAEEAKKLLDGATPTPPPSATMSASARWTNTATRLIRGGEGDGATNARPDRLRVQRDRPPGLCGARP